MAPTLPIDVPQRASVSGVKPVSPARTNDSTLGQMVASKMMVGICDVILALSAPHVTPVVSRGDHYPPIFGQEGLQPYFQS